MNRYSMVKEGAMDLRYLTGITHLNGLSNLLVPPADVTSGPTALKVIAECPTGFASDRIVRYSP